MLTCMSCKINLSFLPHHGHYTSDWHRYNIKRRIAQLPPLTQEQFEEREATFKATNIEKDSKPSLICIECKKQFSSVNAMVSHAKSKKHLQAAAKKREDAKTHRPSIPNKFESKDLAINTNKDEEDEEWSDTDSDWESCEENFDDEVLKDLIENSDYELVLPSGATVGHRSLALYYKQNLRPVSSDNAKKVKKVLQHYKALGYSGSTGPAVLKKARDMVFMQRIKSRYSLKLGVKANKFQPHFRSQVMF